MVALSPHQRENQFLCQQHITGKRNKNYIKKKKIGGYNENVETDAGFDYVLLVVKTKLVQMQYKQNSPRVQGFLKELTRM